MQSIVCGFHYKKINDEKVLVKVTA